MDHDAIRWEMQEELTAAKAENERLRVALRDLLQYGDDHNWGLIPEGETIERARRAITNEQNIQPKEG